MKKHILFLPSWYPSKTVPWAGKFFFDQAQILASSGEYHVSVIDWGQNDYVLYLRRPWTSLKNLIRYLTAKRTKHIINAELIEYKLPHLSWTSLIFKGNINRLIKKINRLINSNLFETQHIDLIFANVTFPAGYVAYQISKQTQVQYMIYEHSGPFPFSEFYMHNQVSKLISEPLLQATQVLAVSDFLAHEINRLLNIEPVVIPNAVNTEFYYPDFTPNNIEIPTFFTLAQITVSKGIFDLIIAIKLLKEQGIKAVFRIGGNGTDAKRFQNLTILYGLQDYICWLGYLTPQQAIEEYRKCTAYILPSHIETFGMVLIEALACGKPVIATRCGGPSEIVSVSNGILVDVGKPYQLMRAIERFINREVSFNQVQITAEATAKYATKTILNQLIKVINDATDIP